MKHVTIFALVVVAAASSGALASNPRTQLEVDTVTGGGEPAVQSLGSSESAQPVDIMNWLIDENGNLKVSNQVRDEMHWFLPEGSEVHLGRGEVWRSPWVDARRFNVLRVYLMASWCETRLATSWGDNHAVAMPFSAAGNVFSAFSIPGPTVSLECHCVSYDDCVVWAAAMYLRAE